MADIHCAHCGYVNRTKRAACKNCRVPLTEAASEAAPLPLAAGAPAASAPTMRGTLVKVYSSAGQFQRDAPKMAAQGWAVMSTTERQPRAGCLRIITLGLFALVFPPQREIVVTYGRQA